MKAFLAGIYTHDDQIGARVQAELANMGYGESFEVSQKSAWLILS